MPFDIPQGDTAPPVEPFDVALKKLIEALGEAPAAQALVEGGATPREAVQAVEQAAATPRRVSAPTHHGRTWQRPTQLGRTNMRGLPRHRSRLAAPTRHAAAG